MIKVRRLHLQLAAVALITWVLASWLAPDEQRKANAVHGADSFSSGYTKLEMDIQGQPKSKLMAAKVVKYDDGITHLTQPVMVFYNEKTPPWTVNSETGELSADGKDLLLAGKAVVTRVASETGKALTINSSNLRVKPETSYAETDDWAELISLPNITTGTGMKLIFVSPVHIELLANVKGKYESKK